MPEATEIVASLPSSQPLKVWERICIVVGDDDNAGTYIARVEDFSNGGIVITNPEFVAGHSRLRDGVEVTVQVTREDAVYQFQTIIRQRTIGGTTRGYISQPPSLERVQRRRFVRIPVSQPVMYQRVVSPVMTSFTCDSTECRRGILIDISGGGALLRVPEQMEARDLLLVQIDFLKKAGVSDCVLVMCRRFFSDKQGMTAGTEFVLSSELPMYFSPEERKLLPQGVGRFDAAAQNKLVAFVFGEQIAMRKKGLL